MTFKYVLKWRMWFGRWRHNDVTTISSWSSLWRSLFLLFLRHRQQLVLLFHLLRRLVGDDAYSDSWARRMFAATTAASASAAASLVMRCWEIDGDDNREYRQLNNAVNCDISFWTYLLTVSTCMNFMFRTTIDAADNILRMHYKNMKCDVSFSQGSVSTLFR